MTVGLGDYFSISLEFFSEECQAAFWLVAAWQGWQLVSGFAAKNLRRKLFLLQLELHFLKNTKISSYGVGRGNLALGGSLIFDDKPGHVIVILPLAS